MNLISRLTTRWLNPIIDKAAKQKLQQSDLQLNDETAHADVAYNEFKEKWQAERAAATAAGRQPSLLRAMRKTYSRDLLKAAVLKLAWGALIVLSASFFVRELLGWLNKYEKGLTDDATKGWILSAFFFVCCFLLSISLQQMGNISSRMGLRIRAALTTSVYRHALAIDMAESKSDILALISTDCTKLQEAASSINYLWSGVAEALAIIGVLIGFVGWPALPGLGLLLLVLPFQYAMGLLAAKLRKRTVAASEKRVRLMDEVLRSAKLVKCYAWEDSFANMVASFRKAETDIQQFSAITKSINLMIVFALPPTIALLIFGVLSIDSDLDSVTAFTTLSLFNTLRLPLVILPKCLRATAEAVSAAARVQEFLLQEEKKSLPRSEEPVVIMSKSNYSYGHPDKPLLLKDINLDVKPGQLVMIAGGVSSGKTNLLQAILGNMVLVNGFALVGGKFAYVPQTPWCQHGTVRDNILFGQPWDEAKYRAVVHACSLSTDFEIMPEGDMTEIGERGVNVSGGQKARIALARAAYSNADIFILDSPLSAVDNFVAQHIFRHCFKNIMRGKTIILVTHALDLLCYADTVVIMKDGGMSYCGPYSPAMVQEHFGFITTSTPDTDVYVERAATVAAQATTAVLENRRESRHHGLTGQSEHDFATNGSGNSDEPADDAAGSDASDDEPVPASRPHQVSFASTPEPASRNRSNSNVLGGTAFPPEEQEAAMVRVLSRRVDIIKALDGAGVLTPGPAGPLPRERSFSGEGITHVHSNRTRTHTSSSADSAAAGPDAVPLTRAVSSESTSIMRSLSGRTPVRSVTAKTLSRNPDGTGAVLVGTDGQRLSRVVSISQKQGGTGIVIDAAAAAANSSSTALTTSGPAAASAQAAALGVPLVTDPHRPARPVRHEKQYNGYFVLFSEVGWVLLLMSLGIFVMTQLTRIFSDSWIAAWVSRKYGYRGETWYVYIYLGYVLLFIILLLLRGIFFYAIFRRASSSMHNRMFAAVLRAPLSWFTITPIGRVLSTFSRDQDNVDEALPDAIMMVTIYVMILCTTMGLVIRVLPFFAAVVGVLALSFIFWFRYYILASRVIKAAAGDSLSSLVAHVSESLQGMAVLRAYGAEGRFAADNMRKLQAMQVSGYNLDSLQVWLQFRLDTIGSLLVLGVSLLCVGLGKELSAANAGLAISNAFQILLFFSLMVRGAAEIDSNISAAERIQQLARVEPEPDREPSYESIPHPSWPHRGEITFNGVHMSYAPSLPRVLKGVSFTIRPCEKIGVVGRTGSGKSSLIMSLFRLVELGEGSIQIDGIDVKVLNLAQLRSRIAILPQDPVLFEGTLRSNLDPFERYSDAELMSVVEKCYLGDVVQSSGKGLALPIAHSGSNMSLGTAQLVCLARALLNKSKILILDEATAALDLETDSAVQKVIRTEFADRTIMTIAHRLDTIIDSDRVLVMNAGLVAEFDTPYSLLCNPGSIFSNLCRQAGPNQYETLLASAARHQRAMTAIAAEVHGELALLEDHVDDAVAGLVPQPSFTDSPGLSDLTGIDVEMDAKAEHTAVQVGTASTVQVETEGGVADVTVSTDVIGAVTVTMHTPADQ